MDQRGNLGENIFEKQLSKIRRMEPSDEFERYCSKETIASLLPTGGSLGWWKVCIPVLRIYV